MSRRILAAIVLMATLFVTLSAHAADTPMLKVGDRIPEFKLPYATKDTIVFDGFGSAQMAGKEYLIAFYPADFSPGCTKEMCSFRDAVTEFEKLNVTVLPVSADLVFAHQEFAKQQNLPFKLLADQTREFGRKMGVYVPDQGLMKRSVFVASPTGTLEYVDYDYSVKDDADFNALKAFLATKR
ncbi:MAG: peroxiredoxin [Candidatus Zixiibacteriota bacterium]